MAQSSLQGVKCNVSYCVVCAGQKELRLIHSKAGEHKNVRSLLLKYGEVDIIEGAVCRTCEKRLLRLESESVRFKAQCQSTFHNYSIKRCTTGSSPHRKPLAEIHCRSVATSQSTASPQSKTLKISRSAAPSVTKSKENIATYPSILPLPVLVKADLLPSLDQFETDRQQALDADKEMYCKSVAQMISEQFSVSPAAYSLTSSQCADINNAVQTKSMESVIDVIFALTCDNRMLQKKLFEQNDAQMDTMKCKTRGSPSMLLSKVGRHSAYETLMGFSWEECVTEFHARFPMICTLLVAMMLGQEKRQKVDDVTEIFQRLGMIYAIVIQCRIPYLSRVQRLMSAVLTDSLVDVKVSNLWFVITSYLGLVSPSIISANINILKPYADNISE